MECQKASPDGSAGQASFFATVITKFTAEGYYTLRSYLETRPDVKDVMNLLLRASRFVDAGLAMARSSMDAEPREKQLKLMVRENMHAKHVLLQLNSHPRLILICRRRLESLAWEKIQLFTSRVRMNTWSFLKRKRYAGCVFFPCYMLQFLHVLNMTFA
jgi:hypothetical protein